MVKKRKSSHPTQSKKVRVSKQQGVQFKGFTSTGKGIFTINGKTYHTSFGATVRYQRAKEQSETTKYTRPTEHEFTVKLPNRVNEEQQIKLIYRGMDKVKNKKAKQFKNNLITMVRDNYNQLVPQLAGNLFNINPDLYQHWEKLVKQVPLYKLDSISSQFYELIDYISKYYHNPYAYDINSLNDDFMQLIRLLEKETNTPPFQFR